MKLRNIRVVYRKELIDSLRDRRTLISMVVVPLLLMPVLTIGIGYVQVKLLAKARQEIPGVMLLGGEDSPRVMAALRALPSIAVAPATPDYAVRISNKEVRAAVEVPRDFDAALERGAPAAVQIYFYQGDIPSGFAAQNLAQFFYQLREQTVRERLQARNLPANLIDPFQVQQKNVAPQEKVAGALFGGILPYLIILMCLSGAMYPAMDLTAGEKERGTIETILCSPIARSELVLGKFFTVLTASIATAVFSMGSLAASYYFGKDFLAASAKAGAAAPSLSFGPAAILAVFAMIVPVAVFLSAALLAIALFAKSFKEAQSYLTPLTLVIVLPAVVGLLPGVELTPKLALVPILSTSLVSKEIMTGAYHWNYILLIFASSCAYAAAALYAAVKLFQREDVLFRA
jgi:sodium transport system permease protein